jgi:hypothetical protein
MAYYVPSCSIISAMSLNNKQVVGIRRAVVHTSSTAALRAMIKAKGGGAPSTCACCVVVLQIVFTAVLLCKVCLRGFMPMPRVVRLSGLVVASAMIFQFVSRHVVPVASLSCVCRRLPEGLN